MAQGDKQSQEGGDVFSSQGRASIWGAEVRPPLVSAWVEVLNKALGSGAGGSGLLQSMFHRFKVFVRWW